MSRYSDTTVEIMKVTESSNVHYMVEVEVTRTELRKGNYSSAASDPDEYYGTCRIDIDILGAYKYDESVPEDVEEGYETFIETWDLPDWVVAEVEYEYDYD